MTEAARPCASEVANEGSYQEVMMMMRVALACLMLAFPVAASSQTYSPTVTMTITAPDGTTQDVMARDSNVGTMKLKDGSEYQFRPTVIDEPFSKVTIAIFKSDSTAVGEVQATKGAPAVTSKTTPSFKIAVKSIELKK
jgi:hypothetical protein